VNESNKNMSKRCCTIRMWIKQPTLNRTMMSRQGTEERKRSQRQPRRGSTMADRQISNIVPLAQHTCPTQTPPGTLKTWILLFITVKSAYKESAYKELPVIRNWFHSTIFSKELVFYTFIRNSGCKEHIFMVLMSSLYAAFTVVH